MNQTRYGLLAVLLCMALLVLQGCGGSDSSGVSQDMFDALQAELDDAETAQTTAEAAAAAAMTAQTMAEAARDTAMEAQTAAEAQATVAMAAQTTADQARQAAVMAQQIAEASEKEARTAEMAAKDAQATVETMRDTYQQGQIDAEAERDMYKTAKMEADTKLAAAETARMTADNARIAAETALAVAKLAEMNAVQARMEAETARDDYKAKLTKAEEELETLKEAMMEASGQEQMDAVAAQRARVDAAAIQKSADEYCGAFVVNAAGGLEMKTLSTTNTVEMFQGTGSVPGDGPDIAPVQPTPMLSAADTQTAKDLAVDLTGELRPNTVPGKTELSTTPGSTPPEDGDPLANTLVSTGVMTLKATRVGDTVTFKATADDDPTDATAAEVLINFEATAGADGMTSGMDEVDLPGQTKHIFLMSDIEAPSTGSFANNKPEGLTLPTSDTDPEYRYGVDANWFYTTAAGVETANRPLADADAAEGSVLNLDRHGSIVLDLGSFAPTSASPIQEIQVGGRLPGSYAGVAGHFRCGVACNSNNNRRTPVRLRENADDEVIADGTWQFVPGATTITLADTDYLVFGAWLKRPDSAVGTGASAAISAGSDLFDVVVMTNEVTAETADANNGILAPHGQGEIQWHGGRLLCRAPRRWECCRVRHVHGDGRVDRRLWRG